MNYLVGFKNIASGEEAGSVTGSQFSSVPCSYVNIKAKADNVGNVYIGKSGVTKVDDTTNVTAGFELNAGEETGWMPVDNLNRFYIICDNSNDGITYLALS